MSDGPVEHDGPDPICREDAYPRYAECEAEVMCVGAVIYPDPRFRSRADDGQVRPTWKCRLDCMRLSDQAPVCGFFNMRNAASPEVKRGSAYRRVWIMASGSSPRKRQRMSKRAFVGKVFRVRIGDTRNDYNGKTHPEGAVYSTIKEFLACVGP